MTTRLYVAAGLCAALWLACDRSSPERPEAAPPLAPAALTVLAEGQTFRYVDPADGAVKTATTVDAIPEAARGSVLVYDPKFPTPAGWEHVANVRADGPVQTLPTQGFLLRPTVLLQGPTAATATTRRGHEVVMFTTQGCGYCRKARAYFKEHDVAHSEYDVERDPKAGPKLAELAKRAGVPASKLQGGVPLIFIDGTPHVGFDKGKIARLLGI